MLARGWFVEGGHGDAGTHENDTYDDEWPDDAPVRLGRRLVVRGRVLLLGRLLGHGMTLLSEDEEVQGKRTTMGEHSVVFWLCQGDTCRACSIFVRYPYAAVV